MIKTYLDICNTRICLQGQRDTNFPEYNAFCTDHVEHPDITIVELNSKKENGLENTFLSYRENDISWYTTDSGGLAMTIPYTYGKEQPAYLYANKDFSYAEYECVYQRLFQIFFSTGGEVIYRNHLIYRGGMVMHAVSINHHGESVLFSGISGMGKTTHADLWTEYEGSHIINGDRATLIPQDYRWITNGSAWSGSSGIYRKETAPIKAIVFLEQADHNHITELTPQHALSFLVPRCFLPFYSQELMSNALSTIDRIALSIPMFLLRNKADRRSMELVRQAVFGR